MSEVRPIPSQVKKDVSHELSLRRADVSGWFEVLVDDDGKRLCEAVGRKRRPIGSSYRYLHSSNAFL